MANRLLFGAMFNKEMWALCCSAGLATMPAEILRVLDDAVSLVSKTTSKALRASLSATGWPPHGTSWCANSHS